MAEVDKDLAKALQAAKKKPRNFAIIAKGANVLKLLIDKKPIKNGDVQKAKQEFQGNAVVKGVVTGGDGPELVFQVTEAPTLGEVKLRKFVTDETALVLKTRFEVVTSLQEVNEDDDEPVTPTAPPPPTTPPPVATTTPPPVPPPAPPPPAASADQLVAAMNKLSPAIKQAVADQPEKKAEIVKTVAAFQTHVKAGELPQAKAALLQVGALIKPPKPAVADVLRERIQEVQAQAARLPEPANSELKGRAQQALAEIGKADPAALATSIDALEADLARATSAARAGEAAPAQGRGVAFRKLLLRWREAQGQFDANLKSLGASLLALPEIKADPRLAQLEKVVAALPQLVPTFGGRLEDALDAGMNTDVPAEVQRLAAESIAAIDAYRQQLAAAAYLQKLEEFAAKDLGAGLRLHGVLDQALVELKQQLAA